MIEYIDSGCIRVGEKPMAERLQTIFHSLATLIGEYRPEEFAIEQVFMARNPDSALKLGQARGGDCSGRQQRFAGSRVFRPPGQAGGGG